MKQIAYIKQHKFPILFIVLGLSYLLFPNHNPTLDAWDYAQCVKYGESLFLPHHLLYNYFFFLLKQLPFLNSIDTLRLMQFVNGLAAIASLYLLRKILLLFYDNDTLAWVWTLFTGSCFAVLRYGTENETYILPIAFSMLASYYFLRVLKTESKKEQNIVWSGLFAAIACLFHQIHFFWWFALFVGVMLYSVKRKKWQLMAMYLLPAFIVPAAYSLVLLLYNQVPLTLENLITFVFDYYFSDNAETSVGMYNFLLTPVSFIRTFIQIHGNILNFIASKHIISTLCILIVVICLLKFLRRSEIKLQTKKPLNLFIFIHLFSFSLQLLFAFFSKGNAEFMVMLPFLLAIFFPYFLTIKSRNFLYLSLGLYVWNISFAILPNFFYDFNNNKALIELISAYPNKKFLLKDHLTIQSQYKYLTYKEISHQIYSVEDKNELIDEASVFTDILSRKTPLNRASIVSEKHNKSDYIYLRQIAKFSSFYGDYTIDEIKICK